MIIAKKLDTEDPNEWHKENSPEKLIISKGENLEIKDKIKA